MFDGLFSWHDIDCKIHVLVIGIEILVYQY